MIKIEATANKTITVTHIEENTIKIILGIDCEILVVDLNHIYSPEIKNRTLTIFNKHNAKTVAMVDAKTLDPSSTNYSTNMDTYAASLRNSILYV